MTPNLWPDFPRDRRRTVRTILIEYGSGIAERTADKIQFRVETDADHAGFKHHCRLDVPSIAYHFPFMTVTNSATTMFPVTTHADAFPRPVVSHTEEELVATLQQVFTAPVTVAMVNQLLDAAE